MFQNGLKFANSDLVILHLNMPTRRLATIDETNIKVPGAFKKQLMKTTFLQPNR